MYSLLFGRVGRTSTTSRKTKIAREKDLLKISPQHPTSQSHLDPSHAIDHDVKSLWLFDKWRTIEVDRRSWITGDDQFHLSRFILLLLFLLTQNRFNDAAIDADQFLVYEEWRSK